MRHLVVQENVCDKDANDQTVDYREETVNLPRIFTDLRQLMFDKVRENKIFVSFELFPVKRNYVLFQRFFSETHKYRPLFYSLTWHSKPPTNNHDTLQLLEKFPANTMLHIAARGFRRNDMERILEKALDCGIRSIFALQGDYAEEDGDFPYAVDLVSFIRERYGATFCICVAGYPQTHPHSLSKESDLEHLKNKVDAGADFIITQFFFESAVFIDFVKDCRKVGITVPILPGMFPIVRYRTLQRMAGMSKVKIPKQLLESLEAIKDDDEAVSNFGVEFTLGMINDILSSGIACGFHIFTLNKLETTIKICERMNIL